MENENNPRASMNYNEIINSTDIFKKFNIPKNESDEKNILNDSYGSEIFFKMKYIINIYNINIYY